MPATIRKFLGLSFLMPLIGCGVPNSDAGVAGFTASLEAVETPLGPVLQKGVDRETQREKERYIAQGLLVYDRPTDCIEIVFGPRTAAEKLDGRSIACEQSPNFKAPLVRGTAAYSAEGLSALRSYANVLININNSDVASSTNENFQNFLVSINDFAKANNVGGAENGLINTAQIEPLGNLVGRAVEARRGAILKRLVNAAHPQIKIIIAELIAQRDPSERLVDQAEALNDAYEDMTSAQDSGDAARYARMTQRYERVFDAFRKSVKNSDAGRLIVLWKSHQILHAQINSPGDPKELIGLLEDFKALAKS